MRLIKNTTELIGIKDQNIIISLVFETDTHIEIQAKLDYPAPSCPHCHGKMIKYDFQKNGSLSTVVGDEKLTSREGQIGPLFMYVQSDEDTFLKVDEVSKTEAQPFDVFDQFISCLQF